ncbi:MAG TPA: nucleotidyltransferase domain-containing protein [Candidatus Saccharimonadales bacterium]
MGRVYTPEIVERGYVPEPGAHAKAGKHILEVFEAGFAADDRYPIASAMVYGSTTLGAATRRSDLDLLINYWSSDTEHEQAAFDIIRSVTRGAQDRYHVYIEPTILQQTALDSPLENNVDTLFRGHLADICSKQPEWCFNDPAGLIESYSLSDPQAIKINTQAGLKFLAIAYTSGKLRQLARGLSSPSDDPNYEMLQRALEVPASIGRKMVALASVNDSGSDLANRNNSFKAFVELSSRLDPKYQTLLPLDGEAMRNDLIALKTADDTYSALLESTLEGSTSIGEYRDWITERYRPICRLAYRIACDWHQVARGSTLVHIDHKDAAEYLTPQIFEFYNLYY